MKHAALCLLACLAAGPACSKANSADQFDLACHGTATGNGRTGPFDLVMHVDLARRQFCFDACELLITFTTVTPRQLTLHYDVDAPGGPKPYGAVNPSGKDGTIIVSSGAPSQQKDDLVVDRATGAFRRDDIYDQGDPAAKRYVEHYAGTCRTAPYTGG